MRFSIITVTKNNKAGLLRAIECVRNQTYNDVEHIIVDGGSTDGTAEVIKNLECRMYNVGEEGVIQKDLPDSKAGMNDLNSAEDSSPRTQNDTSEVDSGSESGMTSQSKYSLVTISEADSGIYDAINKGIKLATGDVIGLLHSDDLFADENILAKYVEAFEQRDSKNHPSTTIDPQPTIDAVYSDLVYVREKSKVKSQKSKYDKKQNTDNSRPTTHYSLLTSNYSIIRYWKTHKSVSGNQKSVNGGLTVHYSQLTDNLLCKGWMPPHPTLFIRKEIFNKYGLYKTDLRIASDYEMILRLFFKFKINTCYLPLTTYFMTIGGASNKSIGNIFLKSKEDYKAMKLNEIPFPFFTLLLKNFRKLPQFLAR